MKICHIHDKAPGPGGVQRYLTDLCDVLTAGGHDCLRVRLVPRLAVARSEAGEWCVTASAGPLSTLRARRMMEDFLRRERPDIVHLHSTFTTMAPAVIRFLARNAPTVYTIHDLAPLRAWGAPIEVSPSQQVSAGASESSPFGKEPWWKRPLRALLSSGSLNACRTLPRLIAANRGFRDALITLGFRQERVALLPLFTRSGTRPIRPFPPHPVVTFAGRLSDEKGILPFLEVLALLPRNDPWEARIAGEGPLRETAKRTSERLGLNGRIQWISRLTPDEIEQLYDESTVVVIPSLIPENFGLAGIEALACGRPVVAFACGGMTEWLEDGKSGSVVQWGQLPEMARRVQELIRDSARAEAMGREGRALVERAFRPRHHALALVDIYEEALGGGIR